MKKRTYIPGGWTVPCGLCTAEINPRTLGGLEHDAPEGDWNGQVYGRHLPDADVLALHRAFREEHLAYCREVELLQAEDEARRLYRAERWKAYAEARRYRAERGLPPLGGWSGFGRWRID